MEDGAAVRAFGRHLLSFYTTLFTGTDSGKVKHARQWRPGNQK